jgi:hypothetical protein
MSLPPLAFSAASSPSTVSTDAQFEGFSNHFNACGSSSLLPAVAKLDCGALELARALQRRVGSRVVIEGILMRWGCPLGPRKAGNV